jgi:hypothetical protein
VGHSQTHRAFRPRRIPQIIASQIFERDVLEALSNKIQLSAMKIAAVFATSFLVGSVAASKSAKVGVTCKNVNVNSLSPKALAYAAKAVEMTYDAVHKNEGAHAVAVGAFASSGGILRSKVSARG